MSKKKSRDDERIEKLNDALKSLPDISRVSQALLSSFDDSEMRTSIMSLTSQCIQIITDIVSKMDMSDERSRIAALSAMDTLLKFLRFLYDCAKPVDSDTDDPVLLLSRLTGISESEIRQYIAAEARINRVRSIIGDNEQD